MARKNISAQAAPAKLSDEITPPLALVEPASPPAEPAPFGIEAVDPATIPMAELRRDPELACRAAGVNKATAAEYAAAMKAGATFPPVTVFRDAKGVCWLADGFHRTAAAELAGLADVAADVRQGGRKEALLFAASANSQHGLRRTTADKRRAVLLVLGAYAKWSDRKIGEACGVDNKTVAAARRSVAAPSEEIPHGENAEAATPAGEEIPHAELVDRLARGIGKIVSRCPDGLKLELRSRLDGFFAGEA